MTPEAALSEMLSRTHEAMGKPSPVVTVVCARCGAKRASNTCGPCLCKPISPRPVVASLLRDVKQIITQRRQGCYGAPWQGDAQQADEMARAIVQLFLMQEAP